MDDLDRLAFRLVRTVRNSYPHLLAQGFTLTDLEERLLPFRDARREMSNNGPEAWEITVLRMVSGERGYLNTDADLQLACRQALSLPSPTVALIRPWSTTTLTLGPAAIQVGNERVQPSSGDSFEASAIGFEFSTDGLPLTTPRAHESAPGTRQVAKQSASQGATLTVAQRATQPVQHNPARHAERTSSERTTTPAAVACTCRFCGGKLPETRKFTFCPHCGVNQTVRQCPACSTELDVQWRFCVTCGRGAELPEIPETLARSPDTIFG